MAGAGGAREQFRFVFGASHARVRLSTEDDNESVEVQADRFVRIWRKAGEATYPRFEPLVKNFAADFRIFQEKVEAAGERLVLNQCELRYANLLGDLPESGMELHRGMGRYVAGWPEGVAVDGCELESVSLASAWVCRVPDAPPARMRVEMRPTIAAGGGRAMFMSLRYSGSPADADPSVEQNLRVVQDFMKRGRERLVRAFASMTTDEMHAVWQRRD